MKKHKCSHCSEFVEPENFVEHANNHLVKMQGMDYSGNVIPSGKSIDFYQVEVSE